MSSTKKRTHDAITTASSASAEITTVAEKPEKKKAPAKPKKVKEPKEAKEVEAGAENGSDEVVNSEEAPAVKRKKPQRFNAHLARNYLDLDLLWRNDDSLRLGLLKAQNQEQTARAAENVEETLKAQSSQARYAGLQKRLHSRRRDVLDQAKLISDLINSGGEGVQELIAVLVKPFAQPQVVEVPEPVVASE